MKLLKSDKPHLFDHYIIYLTILSFIIIGEKSVNDFIRNKIRLFKKGQKRVMLQTLYSATITLNIFEPFLKIEDPSRIN